MYVITSLVLIAAGIATSIVMSVRSSRQQAKQARAQGKAQEAMAKYNAAIAENQAIAERQNAQASQAAAKEESERQRQSNKRLRGRQSVMMAKSGVTVSGTPLIVEEDQLAEMKLQELDIMHSGSLRARQHQLAAMGGESAAGASLFQGRLSKSLAERRASGSMLTGVGSAVGSGLTALGGAVGGLSASGMTQAQMSTASQGVSSTYAASRYSDKRLKENLKQVGTLDNGMKIYIGNYKKGTGLDTAPQLFLIAQEVQEAMPEAVREVDGFLSINYLEAVK